MKKYTSVISILLIILTTNNSFANAYYQFVVFFNVGSALDKLTIETPTAEGSECMAIWAVPKPSVTLDRDNPLLEVTIEDRNGLANCNGDEKKNTWTYKLQKGGDIYTGKFTFRHYSSSGWKTKIDGMKLYMSAYCMSKNNEQYRCDKQPAPIAESDSITIISPSYGIIY